MFSTRRKIEGSNSFGEKTRELDESKKLALRDENGQVIKDKTGRILKGESRGSMEIEAIRVEWNRIVNTALERAGVDARIDHRSYRRQGLDIMPTQHLGNTATVAERAGVRTEIGDKNRAAKLYNLTSFIDKVRGKKPEPKQKTGATEAKPLRPFDDAFNELVIWHTKKNEMAKQLQNKNDQIRKISDEKKRLVASADRYALKRQQAKKAWEKAHPILSVFNSDGYKKSEEWKKAAYAERKVLRLAKDAHEKEPEKRKALTNDRAKILRAEEGYEAKIAELVKANPALERYANNSALLHGKVAEQQKQQNRAALEATKQAQEARRAERAVEQSGQPPRPLQRPGMRPG
jgi:hypothetical protein